MIDRIMTGWNFQRFLFLLMGTVTMIQAISDRMWPGIFLGAYFASMGLFAFGCAAGNCYTRQPMRQTVDDNEEVTFSELKVSKK